MTVKDLDRRLMDLLEDQVVCIEYDGSHDNGIYALDSIDTYDKQFFELDKSIAVFSSKHDRKISDYIAFRKE